MLSISLLTVFVKWMYVCAQIFDHHLKHTAFLCEIMEKNPWLKFPDVEENHPDCEVWEVDVV